KHRAASEPETLPLKQVRENDREIYPCTCSCSHTHHGGFRAARPRTPERSQRWTDGRRGWRTRGTTHINQNNYRQHLRRGRKTHKHERIQRISSRGERIKSRNHQAGTIRE